MKRWLWVSVLALVLVLAPSVSANVRVPGGDVPFYARIGRSEIYHTADWAAIAFYRPPDCIPETFNLLDFFDIPAAFGCGPTTTEGFEIRTTASPDETPKLTQLHAVDKVPVWFISWPALQAAMADDVLTIGELRALPPTERLEGSASFFQEVLRPWPGVKFSTIALNAAGLLKDGRGFRLHIQGVGEGVESCTQHCIVRIAFS